MLKIHRKNVAIIPIHDPDVTRGGIIIPERFKGRCDQGIVKYVGADVKDLNPGDYVLFSGYSGLLMHIEGEGELILTREHTIAAVIPETGNIQIPGLYFRDPDGEYFPATYEAAMNFIAMAFRNTELHQYLHKNVVIPKEMDWVEIEQEADKDER